MSKYNRTNCKTFVFKEININGKFIRNHMSDVYDMVESFKWRLDWEREGYYLTDDITIYMMDIYILY